MNIPYFKSHNHRLISLLCLLLSIAAPVKCWAEEAIYAEPLHTVPAKSCIFCDEKVIHKQKFAENELAMSLVDIRPMHEGHYLILPKRHVTFYHELTHAEHVAISEQIKRTYEALYLIKGPLHYYIINKNGELAGQTIPHAHVHFVPQYLDEEQIKHGVHFNAVTGTLHSLNQYFWSFISSYLPRLTDEELEEHVKQMKAAIAKLDEEEHNNDFKSSENVSHTH